MYLYEIPRITTIYGYDSPDGLEKHSPPSVSVQIFYDGLGTAYGFSLAGKMGRDNFRALGKILKDNGCHTSRYDRPTGSNGKQRLRTVAL